MRFFMSKPFVFKARFKVADLFHHSNHKAFFTAALNKNESLEHFVIKLLSFCALSFEDKALINTTGDKQTPDVWLEGEQGDIKVACYNSHLLIGDLIKLAKQYEKLVLIVENNTAWFEELSPHLIQFSNISIFTLNNNFIAQLVDALTQSLHWDIIFEQNSVSISDGEHYFQANVEQLV